MNKEGHITTLPKRDLKTRSYNMDMNKKDPKRLSKSQLMKLLLKQEAKKQIANEFENSIASPPNQEESVPHKSVNDYEDIVLPPPEQFQDKKDCQNPIDNHHHQKTISISMMTYSKPKTKALKNSK